MFLVSPKEPATIGFQYMYYNFIRQNVQAKRIDTNKKYVILSYFWDIIIKNNRRCNMESKDTIHLLKECDAGSKMAVTSIDEVLEYTQNNELKELLCKSKEREFVTPYSSKYLESLKNRLIFLSNFQK